MLTVEFLTTETIKAWTGTNRRLGQIRQIKEWGVEYAGQPSDLISEIILDYRALVLPTKAPRTQRDYRV